MKRFGALTIIAVQLAVIVSWLMTAWVFIATPPRMATVVGIPQSVRREIGIAMLLLALVPLAGLLSRSRKLTTVGFAAFAVGGVAWILYDIQRHWIAFVIFYGLLTIASITLVIASARHR